MARKFLYIVAALTVLLIALPVVAWLSITGRGYCPARSAS